MRPNWFVGLVPHPETLKRLYETIYSSPPRGLRAYDVEDLHVTLAFFGACDPDVALQAWTQNDMSLQATTLKLGGAQLFGRASRATALGFNVEAVKYGDAANVHADTAFRQFIGPYRDALLEAANRPADPRIPRPHLTIARLPRGLTPLQRRTVIRWAEEIRVTEHLPVEAVALYRSADREAGGAGGQRYAIVEECKLTQQTD